MVSWPRRTEPCCYVDFYLDEATFMELLTFLDSVMDHGAEGAGVGGGAVYLTDGAEGVLSLCACFLIFKVHAHRNSAPLTVPLVGGVPSVVELPGT